MSFFKDIWGNWKEGTGMAGEMHNMTNSWYHSLASTGLYGTGVVDVLKSINNIFGANIGLGWASQFDPGTNYRYLIKPALISTFTHNLGNTKKGESQYRELQDKNTQFYKKGSDNGNDTRQDSIYAAHLNSNDDNKEVFNPHAFKFTTDNANSLSFKFPDWGYADFINERAIFQKSLYSGVGEKGWFYFKIFFNFDTQYGLFGGLLNNYGGYTYSANSAARYLWLSSRLYPQELLNDRIVALHKFASILSFISSNAPWFFKSVKNLNQANIPKIVELTKEKSIEIEFNPDAVDMRINTMFDLYKFACFDDIGQKEIIPENLRKFDMTVVMFEAPLRYLHTGTISKTFGKFDYKTMNYSASKGFGNMMSFKMFHFMNCEFDLTTLGNTIPSTMTNEQPFDTANASIKINYDRVYTHTMNEFMEIMFGSDGIYYNTQEVESLKEYATQSKIPENVTAIKGTGVNNLQDQRYQALQFALRNGYAPTSGSLPEIVDAAEAICHLGLKKFGGNVLGNIAGAGAETGIEHFSSSGRYIPEGIRSKYFNYKFTKMYGHKEEGDTRKMGGNDKLYEDLKNYYGNLTLSMWGKDKS